MNIAVDQQACIGCEQCADMCPAVFTMEDGKSTVRSNPVPGELETDCREVMADCPEKAISAQIPRAFMLLSRGEPAPRWLAL